MGFTDVLWSILIAYACVAALLVLAAVIVDLVQDDDLSGWGKACWIFVLFLLPVVGLILYLISRGAGIPGRTRERRAAARAPVEAGPAR